MEREQTTIRLPVELKQEIQKEAERKGISFNAEMVIMIQKGQEAELGHVPFHNYLHKN